MEERVEWRRHPFTLISKTWIILLQLLLSLAAISLLPLILPDFSVEKAATAAMLFCCLFTLLAATLQWKSIRSAESTPQQARRVLLARMSKPWRLIVIVAGFAFAGLLVVYFLFVGPLFVRPVTGPAYPWIAIASYYLFVAGWAALEYVDWRNEQYVLTSNSIIDVARVPIFYSQRTEVPLARVQDVTASQTFLGGLFGYGKVVVQTAGRAQAVVFEDIPFPYRIQQTIFQHIDRLNEREREDSRGAWGEQTLRWLEGYHDLTTRIECQRYKTEIPVGRPNHIRWKVNLPDGVEYETYLDWDTGSHDEDDTYARHTQAKDGSGSSWYFEIVPPQVIPCSVYFKARVAVLRNGRELYSTTEEFYTVVR